MQVGPEVHLGGGLAPAELCHPDAVGWENTNDGGVHSMNPDFETSQEALAFLPFAKAGWMF